MNVYSLYHIYGNQHDETVEVHFETNDDADSGYPGQVVSANYHFAKAFGKSALARALQLTKYSLGPNETWGGGTREVYLNGDVVTKELYDQLLADDEN